MLTVVHHRQTLLRPSAAATPAQSTASTIDIPPTNSIVSALGLSFTLSDGVVADHLPTPLDFYFLLRFKAILHALSA